MLSKIYRLQATPSCHAFTVFMVQEHCEPRLRFVTPREVILGTSLSFGGVYLRGSRRRNETHCKPGRASLSRSLARHTNNGPDGSRRIPAIAPPQKKPRIALARSSGARFSSERNYERRKLWKNHW